MKRIVYCLALAVLPMSGETPERPIAEIALYYDFAHQPPDSVQEALQQETTSILEPLSQSIEWRSLSGVRPGDVAVDLAVLSFKGSCDLSSPLPRPTSQRTLGVTHISDGVILPFSDIDCDRIRAFLNRELLAINPGFRGAVFGRAVGRVVAHELYHIFGNTTHHGSSGVARSSFTAKELIAESFRLDEIDFPSPKPPVEAKPAGKNASMFPDGRSVFSGGGCTTCHGFRGEGTANGPALRTVHSFNVLSLGAKFANKASQMYRRARSLKVPLPSFRKNEMRALVQYLNNGLK